MKSKVCILGSFNVDLVAKVARFPKGGESLMAQGSSLGPGGKGANQAQAASQAGAKVHFVSKVGTDQFSQFAMEHLSSSSIHSFKLYQSEQEPTGSAIIYVSQENGENMIAIYSGANTTITDEEVAELRTELSDAGVLLVQLENNFSATLNAMKLAQALGVRVIMNPAPLLARGHSSPAVCGCDYPKRNGSIAAFRHRGNGYGERQACSHFHCRNGRRPRHYYHGLTRRAAL